MAFNVSDFRANTRDLARQYQFQVAIIFPADVPGATSDKVNILAQSTSIPGREIDAMDVPFMGAQYKLAGQVTYPDWEVTFRIDDNYDIYKKFRAWSELIKGTETNIASFPSQYKTDPELYQLDGAGNKLTKITLKGAFPMSISEVALDMGATEIQELSVSFAYDYNIFSVE